MLKKLIEKIFILKIRRNNEPVAVIPKALAR
jgi:hypothetical protein